MGFPANKAGKRLEMPFFNAFPFSNVPVAFSQEQSSAQIDLMRLLSSFDRTTLQKGSSNNVFRRINLTDSARPNLTNLAAVHLEGSSCLYISTCTRIRHLRLPKI